MSGQERFALDSTFWINLITLMVSIGLAPLARSTGRSLGLAVAVAWITGGLVVAGVLLP